MTAWLALSFELSGLDPQVAEEACFAAGATSVTLADGADDAVLEPAPGEVRLWPSTLLKALFPAQSAGPEILVQLAAALGLPLERLHAEHIQDRAWEREWLKDFHAMRFGRRLWVVPSHEPLPQDPAAVAVRLDPGLAFGTGTHPSTAMCLAWLDAHLAPGCRVIDYGCGSGVLAVAAAKLGAARVDAFDIDPQALIATRDNAVANGVGDRVFVHECTDTLPHGADVLLANILAGTLIELAPQLAARVTAGGRLVLGGILRQQAHEVRAAYADLLPVEVFATREDWAALAS